MPRLKVREAPFAKIGRLCKSYDINAPKLAAILGCSRPTAKKKLDDPTCLTIGDLDKINRRGGIAWEEIRESIVR